jgi:hypothetical protein
MSARGAPAAIRSQDRVGLHKRLIFRGIYA